ncbi:glycoside hydrolase family 125 protein [Flavihumibacter fluvii]|uniref:glycoside hydrolase family 125 protein n=1 Tax=Flavihumibacter fluvii TaxID=2838157 RepID=UPI001BDE5988|nr:glycoside hydrolase family 125 protein [Flavihumibacter fluvii]ULQ54164.1 glycoside hydrolase family 125 protein [Flavihumibacter fluvii]
MDRRKFIRQSGLATAGLVIAARSQGFSGSADFPDVRLPLASRKFSSKAVEQLISDLRRKTANKELGWLFENCFPNTLDTTVDFTTIDGKPDTYVITGDIDAMWLRDSSAQVWPYIPLCHQDKELQQLIKGVINRQVKNILKDPYANAFYKDETKESEWKHTDITEMKAGIHERKWEIDSLCYPIRLSHGYLAETGDMSVFDDQWVAAMRLVVATFREQQRFHGAGPYTFQRNTAWATDGVPMGGYGYPARPNGLICSMFRPSDDATIYPYLIPSNYFAVESLLQLESILLRKGNLEQDAKAAKSLALQVSDALKAHAITHHPKYGNIIAYETNGFGSFNLMDDANVPSLLSLPYLGAIKATDPLYKQTRNYVLSLDNPFYFKGTKLAGTGGPHIGLDMVWPMSIVMQGLTSNDEKEIKYCLNTLQHCHAGTGFMHESAHKDDPAKFTRKWFAWANTIFGEFIWKVYREKPALLQ